MRFCHFGASFIRSTGEMAINYPTERASIYLLALRIVHYVFAARAD